MSEPSITCPVCGRTSYHPKDVTEGYCGHCRDWTARANQPEAPTGVEIVYRDGTTVVPGSVDYLGLDPETRQHVWVARLRRPLRPGLASVRVAKLPARTTVMCG